MFVTRPLLPRKSARTKYLGRVGTAILHVSVTEGRPYEDISMYLRTRLRSNLREKTKRRTSKASASDGFEEWKAGRKGE